MVRPVELPERIDNQPIIEMSLIESIRTPEHIRTIEGSSPTWMMFGNAYAIVLEYHAKTGDVPPPGLLATRIAGWAPQSGEFEYWFEQYIRIRTINAGLDIFQTAIKALQRDHPLDVLNRTVEQIQSLGQPIDTLGQPIDIQITDRLERYRAAVAHNAENGKRMRGMRTGFGVIDRTRLGWQPSEMIGLYARPSVGKTWVLIRQSVIAWLSGMRVLLVSTEMSADEIARRFDTVLAGHTGIAYSHRRVQDEDPNMIGAMERLRDRITTGGARERIWVRDHQLTVAQIATAASYYQADVVLVDGISQISPDNPRMSGWEQMKQISYGLRDMALRQGCIVFVTHQSVNKQRGKKGDSSAQGRGDDWSMPSLSDAAYGDSFVQACSTVITMAPDRDHSRLRWYSVRKSRERGDVFAERTAMAWDVDRGVIIDLVDAGLSMDAIRAEMRKYDVELG